MTYYCAWSMQISITREPASLLLSKNVSMLAAHLSGRKRCPFSERADGERLIKTAQASTPPPERFTPSVPLSVPVSLPLPPLRQHKPSFCGHGCAHPDAASCGRDPCGFRRRGGSPMAPPSLHAYCCRLRRAPRNLERRYIVPYGAGGLARKWEHTTETARQ